MKKYRMVKVIWYDAITSHGWENAEVAAATAESHPCESIGDLLRSTKKEVVLAQTIGGTEINGRITIPRAFIRAKLQTLK